MAKPRVLSGTLMIMSTPSVRLEPVFVQIRLIRDRLCVDDLCTRGGFGPPSILSA